MPRTLWLLIAALPVLSGCPEAVKPVVTPQIVRVEVPVYVPIPAELTADCPIAEPASLKVQEVVRVANARKISLQNCNVDKAKLRELSATTTKDQP